MTERQTANGQKKAEVSIKDLDHLLSIKFEYLLIDTNIVKNMAQGKIPNKIYSDGKTTIGFLQTHQIFLDFHVENSYCIQNLRRFEAYKRAGYSLYIIDNGLEEDFIKYA